MTHFVCEILDSFRDGGIHILVFGLAFPKLVGRLLSLRPPLQTRINWVCPIPFPEWITEGINESILLAAFGAGFGTDWEDEPLIKARRYAPRDSGKDVLIQELMLSGHQSEPILPASYEWMKSTLCSALLPREILVAAGQVQNHLESPYTAGEEVVLRPVPKRFLDVEVYETAQHQRAHVIPGWDVRWKHVMQ